MKSTGIGDMILTTAVARDVMAAHPDAEVVVFAGADNADVARLVPGVRIAQLATAKALGRHPAVAGRAARRDRRLRPMDTPGSAVRGAFGGLLEGGLRHPGPAPSLRLRRNRGSLREPVGAGELPRADLDDRRHLHVRPLSRPARPARPLPVEGPFVVFHLWPGGFRSQLRGAAPWREPRRSVHEGWIHDRAHRRACRRREDGRSSSNRAAISRST